MASRKSRSYANPDYQAQVERYAPEQAYRRAVQDVNHRVVQYVRQAYRSDPRFLTDQGHIDRLTALMAPAVEAGQLQIADLTNAHLSTLFGVKEPPSPDLSSFARDGVSRTTELARPFWTAIKAAKEGKDFDAALAAGEARLSKMVQTDLQMAKVRQAREVLKAGHIQTYARVTGDTACWLCEIAATQVYYTEDLLPIHPSCVVSGTLVTVPSDQAGASGLLGSVEAATRQKFVGEIVELSTASGNFVRVTPNHPVLTDKGWIPAGLIRKGDNVFRSLRGERPVDGRPDVAQRPSRIEDVFAAASVTGRLLRVPTTAEDFHGDGSDNEVDVVWTASDLALPLDVLSVQQPSELCLMHAHGLGVPLVGQGAFDGLAGTRFAASRSNIRGGGDRGALLDGGAFVSQSGGSLRSARFNPTAAQFDGDGITSYAEQGRALIDRLAGKVERDSVIECRRVSFAGHVFNLQTAEGWYVADNIVLSNCNCSVKPIPDGGEADIRKGFTPDEIFAHATDQVKLMTGLVESDASLKEYQDLLAVREHGEIGPTLTWKHQNFTGPQDLPVPPSREVLEHQAFEAVKKTGGVTIDLAGNTPTDGFAYAPLKGTEVVVPQGEFSPKHIDDFINTHAADLARPGNHLGMWTQDGNVYLDVSRVGAPTAETLAKAQGAHQLAVYDLGNGHDINLGTVDNAGKYTAIGSPTGVLDQYRGEVARANEAVGAGRVPGVAARESARAAEQLAWDGPPVVKPQKVSDSIYSKDWVAGNNVDYHWANDRWDEWSPAMRAGGREAQTEGYTGIKEMGKRKSRWDNPTEHELRIEGKEIVARAVRAEPSTEVFYRGMGVTQEQIDKLAVGQSISMPLSSFTGGGPGSKKYAIHFATESATGGVNRPKNAKPVLLQLQPGAKLADVHDHSVGFGQFDITKVTPATSRTPRIVTIRQTSMIEADIARTPGTTSVLERPKKIPDITFVEKPPELPKGVPPKGMDREDWITKVQPGPIPDYDNPYAVTTQLKARHPDLHADLGGMIDASCARSSAQAVDDLLTKYPDAQLRSVVARGPYNFQNSSRFAQTDVFSSTGGPAKRLSETEIQYNQDFYMKKDRLDKTYAKTVDQLYHPPIGDHDAAYAITTHEFAHSMDASGSYRAGGEVKDTLRKVFADEVLMGDETPEQIRAAWDTWIEHNLSGYSAPGGKLNPTEALAEAFTHVELDPGSANDAERALHKLVVDKHTLPYKSDMTVPEWQMATTKTPVNKGDRYLRKYQKQTDAYFQAHATPEELANAKEAKRVASQQETARKKAQQAVERGKGDAIPKAELVKAKAERVKGIARNTTSPMGDPGGVEEITRAAMDVERIKANRRALWDEVPPKIRAEGKVWYPGETQVLSDIHAAAGSPFAGDPLGDIKVQAVGASFSPQVEWADAKTDAANYFRNMDKPYQDKVDAIVNGRGRMVYTDGIKRSDRVRVATTREEIDLALRGDLSTKSHHYDNSPKIRNFLGNLTGEHDLLTADTWDGKAARLHPDERRFLINEEIRQKNYRLKHPVRLEDLPLYQKGDRIPSYLVDRANDLADAANDAARAAGRRQPYLPNPGLMVAHGYDILEASAVESLPAGYTVDQYQAGLWIWLRGGGATGLAGVL